VTLLFSFVEGWLEMMKEKIPQLMLSIRKAITLFKSKMFSLARYLQTKFLTSFIFLNEAILFFFSLDNFYLRIQDKVVREYQGDNK
jgi:hypothetical protein